MEFQSGKLNLEWKFEFKVNLNSDWEFEFGVRIWIRSENLNLEWEVEFGITNLNSEWWFSSLSMDLEFRVWSIWIRSYQFEWILKLLLMLPLWATVCVCFCSTSFCMITFATIYFELLPLGLEHPPDWGPARGNHVNVTVISTLSWLFKVIADIARLITLHPLRYHIAIRNYHNVIRITLPSSR